MSQPPNDEIPKRKFFLQKRRTLNQKQRQLCAKRASLQLTTLRRLLPKKACIGLYWDAFGEMPTFVLFDFCKRYGHRPFLPVVCGNRLVFCPINPKNTDIFWSNRLPKKRHALAMNEPIAPTFVSVHSMDMVFCPLVAIDKQGVRMGMGGGFYDRTLITYQGLKIGWCYDFQYTQVLNTNPWDIAMDWIVTPTRCLKI